MKIINIILSGLSACVAFGTGWAIYTGATRALGMWWVIALIVAGAIIALDIAAGLLITDIYRFNQGARNQTERVLLMPVAGAWISLGLAIVTEIVLSLLVVVFHTISVWGVLVFPPMTLAGIFVNSLRLDLQTREAEREQLRVKAKQKRTEKKHDEKPSRNKKKVARQPISDAILEGYFAGNPGATDTQVAEHFGVTRQAIGKRRKKLYSIGVER
jgi:hypothetical protein